MSDQPLYRVLFKGVLTGEYDLESTKARFGKLFRLDSPRLEKLFSGKEFILKDRVDEHVAMTFAIRVAEAGCECYIEGVPEEEDRQHRELADRRQTQRRAPRQADATDRERRAGTGRRRADTKGKAADGQRGAI